METLEKDLSYFTGFDSGVNFVLMSIANNFENGVELVEMIKQVMDPELDKLKEIRE
jgi:hypothetical protein